LFFLQYNNANFLLPSPPSSHYHQTHSSQARITSSPSSHYRQTSTTSLMILSRRWNTTSRTEAIQSAQRVSNKLISCWDSERPGVYLRRRDTLVASLGHLLMSPVFYRKSHKPLHLHWEPLQKSPMKPFLLGLISWIWRLYRA
jgi:hypothetical protein